MIARSLPAPWLDFVGWCRARGLKPLPAHPWTLAAYARWCEPRHRYPTIIARVRAIARIHLLKCATSPDRHPTVVRTLELIEARDHARCVRADLFRLDDGPGERPAEADGPRARKPSKKPAKAKAAKETRRRVAQGLRLTLPLVSRRPRPAGDGAGHG